MTYALLSHVPKPNMQSKFNLNVFSVTGGDNRLPFLSNAEILPWH